jgi:hypothetical protein
MINKEYDDSLGTRIYKCLKVKDQKHLKLYRARAYRIGIASDIIMKKMHHESEMLSLIGAHPNIVSLHQKAITKKNVYLI